MQEKKLRSHLTVALFSHSSRQKQQWLDSAVAAGEEYAFRDDSALHICLLHTTLQGARVRVGRLWTHVCNLLGDEIDFAIDLNDVQRRDVERRLTQAAQMQV
ncbi:hypothetical protein [Massilia sp. YMA4]|uniref:hypothetical protein n=1 Tax=Massilia sp. YMA4 TaxID=1593482 RepID=UPI000DD148BD|nr:hypothetical protein [Massilia sp. YMA4]AXA92021.1 hypothetical protein DPH57_13205 [Massilia sp. YMA4]